MEVSFDTRLSTGATEAAEGFDYVPTTDDVSIPFIRLGQALTAEVVAGDAKAGQYILPDGSLSDTISARIIGIRRTRQFRDDDNILCRSQDGVTGVGDPGGACDACPLSQWSGDDKKRQPPACTLSYQYLMDYEGPEETIGVGVLSMSTRSASKVAAQLNTYVKMYGPGTTLVTLGSSLVTKNKRSFYVPTLSQARPMAPRLEDKSEPKQLEDKSEPKQLESKPDLEQGTLFDE